MDILMPEPVAASGVTARCCTVIDAGATMWASVKMKNKKETKIMGKLFMIQLMSKQTTIHKSDTGLNCCLLTTWMFCGKVRAPHKLSNVWTGGSTASTWVWLYTATDASHTTGTLKTLLRRSPKVKFRSWHRMFNVAVCDSAASGGKRRALVKPRKASSSRSAVF